MVVTRLALWIYPQREGTRPPQRDVYVTHEELGQRLLSLPHGPLTLDCLARNSAEDHALMDDLMQQEGPEGFAAAWLRQHGHTEAAQTVAAWSRTQREKTSQPPGGCTTEGDIDAATTAALRGAE